MKSMVELRLVSQVVETSCKIKAVVVIVVERRSSVSHMVINFGPINADASRATRAHDLNAVGTTLYETTVCISLTLMGH